MPNRLGDLDVNERRAAERRAMGIPEPRPARLTGAALNARVVANCRVMLAEDYGLPMASYDVSDVDRYSIGSDMQPILTVTFKHKLTGHEVQVSEIHPGDRGELDTYGSNYGRLTI